MFRTPVEVLRRSDGSVQCGECSSVFVALKHAVLLDSPIVELVSSHVVEVKPRRSWTGLIFLSWLVGLCLVGAGVSHLGLVRNAFSLEYVNTVAPVYKVFDMSMPLYRGIDGFVLGPSSLKKDDDQSIRLSFTLHNRAGVPTSWPKLKVLLLGAGGQTTYEVVTNVDELLYLPPVSVGAMSSFILEAHISAEKSKGAVTYKLEVINR